MRSNYKRIGNYIELVDERNKDLKITLLLGLSISKQFIPSVANTVGANMKNYKVIRKGQFACSIMQVRRDKKMPVALLKDYDKAIISQAYPVFKIIDEKELLPEYLMMWFSRAEFDRHAEFLAVGGVRGSLEWEDFLDMELPVPSISTQREIIKEYNTIVNRITLNKKLNKKLEETAQALYKHWFVDFNFPITKESYPELVSGSPDLEGKPYKLSGGNMIYNEELDKEIPVGWDVVSLGSVIDHKKGKAFKSDMYQEVGISIVRVSDLTKRSVDFSNCYCIGENHYEDFIDVVLKANDIIITSVGSWASNPDSVVGKVIKVPETNNRSLLNQNMVRLRTKINECQLFLYTALSRKEFSEYVISGAQGSANQASVTLDHLFDYNLSLPKREKLNLLSTKFNLLYSKSSISESEINIMKDLKNLLLSKMTKVEVENEVA